MPDDCDNDILAIGAFKYVHSEGKLQTDIQHKQSLGDKTYHELTKLILCPTHLKNPMA